MSKRHIDDCIRASLEQYFKDLRGTEPHSLHDMIMNAVEKPLIDAVNLYAPSGRLRRA